MTNINAYQFMFNFALHFELQKFNRNILKVRWYIVAKINAYDSKKKDIILIWKNTHYNKLFDSYILIFQFFLLFNFYIGKVYN